MPEPLSHPAFTNGQAVFMFYFNSLDTVYFISLNLIIMVDLKSLSTKSNIWNF